MPFDPSHAPIIFGEVLFDCFPDAEVLGGAPFNVAWHLAAFGAAPLFVSRVGEDGLGDRIESAMQARGMSTTGLQRDASHPTGSVQVTLTGGEPSYDIVEHRAYDFIDADNLPAVAQGALLYHGSLALRGGESASALERLRAGTDAVFLDVNLRDPWWSRDQVIALLDGARWVKLNADELAELAPSGNNPEARAAALIERHGLGRAYVTLGAEGAFALGADGEKESIRPGGDVDVVDAVGAGDGFASVLILGLLRNWPLQQTLARAQDFASAIVGRRGATVADDSFYAEFVRTWNGA
jgi:fructokinase